MQQPFQVVRVLDMPVIFARARSSDCTVSNRAGSMSGSCALDRALCSGSPPRSRGSSRVCRAFFPNGFDASASER